MEYYIKADEKVTTWVRRTFAVTASSKDEAVQKVVRCYKKGGDPCNDDDDIRGVDSEELCDFEEPMTVEENGGCPTVEVIDGGNGTIWHNGTIS